MGMSASQARLLSLQARQSNLEYQGQQINQERTILSQQCTALYNSLLSMTVPTPPATTDYQTIKYTGELGATKYSFDANSIKPNGTGDTYTITMKEQKHGDSLQKNATIATVDTTKGSGGFRGEVINTKAATQTNQTTEIKTGSFQEDKNGNVYIVPVSQDEINSNVESQKQGIYYKKVGDKYVKYTGLPENGCYKGGKPSDTGVVRVKEDTIKSNEIVTNNNGLGFIQSSQLSNYYVKDKDTGKARAATINDFDQNEASPNVLKFKPDVTYLQKSTNGTTVLDMLGDIEGVTVGGKGVHALSDTEKQQYGDAIANCGLKDANGNAYTVDDFYMYYNDKGGAVFVLASDVNDGNNNAITYNYAANGEFTKNQEYNDAKLTFDPTNGRITEIAIPNYDDAGNVTSWTSISVSAETVTDEAAYNDAYAQYEYDTYLYDQKNKEINAKTEVIQQEDKNLELKLQRLDNERTQITTEIEAVKKVINDNIEGSYKTFSG